MRAGNVGGDADFREVRWDHREASPCASRRRGRRIARTFLSIGSCRRRRAWARGQQGRRHPNRHRNQNLQSLIHPFWTMDRRQRSSVREPTFAVLERRIRGQQRDRFPRLIDTWPAIRVSRRTRVPAWKPNHGWIGLSSKPQGRSTRPARAEELGPPGRGGVFSAPIRLDSEDTFHGPTL